MSDKFNFPSIYSHSRQMLIEKTDAAETDNPVPIDFRETDVAVHKTHHVFGILILKWLLPFVGADADAAGNLTSVWPD
ncbi:MAG TPA: hypothetical protein VGO57_17820 [Verrucomicrobiae bacterium]